MMQISNVNAAGSNMQAVREQPNVSGDSVSKEIESKIMNAQKQRKELSSNTEMTAEEKAEMRQKIQQEISELKRELRQRQAEEKRKQQEAEKAEKIKEEQKKTAHGENGKGQQNNRPVQGTDGQQEKMREPDNGRTEESQKTGEQRGEKLPGIIHQSLSKKSAMNQVRILENTAAKRERAVSVRETEINQDAARGVEVEALKREQRAELQKEARRAEQMQNFMLGGLSKKTGSDEGTVKKISGGTQGKGLYGNGGTMFKTNFQSIQMDMKQ